MPRRGLILPWPLVRRYHNLNQWFPTFFELGPLLVCWRAWGATSGVFRNWTRGWTEKDGLGNGSPQAGARGKVPVAVQGQGPRNWAIFRN